jgi:outer membrane biosynthesis protein TonB
MVTPKQGSTAPRPPRPGGGFKLTKFPKEFEKSLFQDFDQVYSTVLLISIVFLFGLVGFLSSNAVDFFGYDEDELAERTQKILQKVYQVEIEELPERVEEEVPKEDSEQSADREERIKESQQKPKEQRQVSAQDRRDQRAALAASRRNRRDAERQKVASSAQLALITGGAGSSGEAVADVLGQASNTNVDLDAALKSGAGIAVAQSSGARTRSTAGARAAGGDGVDGLVSGISGVSSTSLGERRGSIDFAEVELAERSSDASRSRSVIQAELSKIEKAVENCFKKAKRLNPQLKGFVKVSFIIAANGSIKKVQITQDTIKDRSVSSCVTTSVRRIRRFQRAQKDFGPVNVKYTI